MPRNFQEHARLLMHRLIQEGRFVNDDGFPATPEIEKYKKNEKKIYELSPVGFRSVLCGENVSNRLELIRDNLDYIDKNFDEIFDGYLNDSIFKDMNYDDLINLNKMSPSLFLKMINEASFEFTSELDGNAVYSLLMNNKEIIDQVNGSVFCKMFEKILSFSEPVNFEEVNQLYLDSLKDNHEKNKLVFEKYIDKINSLEDKDKILFSTYIENHDTYRKFIDQNASIFLDSLKEKGSEFLVYYMDCNRGDRRYFFEKFHEIIGTFDFTSFIFINEKHLLETFNTKERLDKLPITNIMYLRFFDAKLKEYLYSRRDEIDYQKFYFIEECSDRLSFNKFVKEVLSEILDYVNMNIKIDGKLNDLSDYDNIELYSSEFLKNIYELRNNINLDDKNTREFFISKIIKAKEGKISNSNDLNILFNLLKSGKASLLEISKLDSNNKVLMFNKLRFSEFDDKFFLYDQLKEINIKRLNFLLKKYGDYNKEFDEVFFKKNDIIIKSYLLFGFNNSQVLLDKANIRDLEHLVYPIDTSLIKIDKSHEPIVNKKLNNLLFSDKETIEKIFKEKDSDLYNYFPRLFIEWDGLDFYNKNTLSLKKCLELLKNSIIVMPPRYYKLSEQLQYIGVGDTKVAASKVLYNKITNRICSSIPTVSGKSGKYNYQVLKYNDYSQMSVGSKTNCCFTVDGLSRKSLEHGCSSEHGRIFTVTCDDKLVAHSWLWRNGNLLCFDNIETAKGLKELDFLGCYKCCCDEIIKISREKEKEEAIDVVTIGVHSDDDKIIGINKLNFYSLEGYKSFISDGNRIELKQLPQPSYNGAIYSDAKKTQVILRQFGDINLFNSKYLYYDERDKKILEYHKDREYKKEEFNNINILFNNIMSRKYELSDSTSNYTIADYKDVYIGNDFAITVNKDKKIDIIDLEIDKRSKREIEKVVHKIKK